MTKSKGIRAPRAFWSADDLVTLKRDYADKKTADLAKALGKSLQGTYAKANALGLKKSDDYLASPDACRLRRGDNVGAEFRFKPGQPSWNDGKKIGTRGRSAETQFNPGQRPANWKPLGSERLMDGYLQRKMTETGYPPTDWVPVHILLWQEHNGPVPDKHCVIFKDGNKANIVIENLECISRSDLMKRNSLHNMPPQLTELVQLRGVLTRQINKRSKT